MYVLLLRGVNLAGRSVPKNELQQVAIELGYTHVSTYINSGNLICACQQSAEEVAAELEQALADRFGFAVDVMARTGTELDAVLAANPYPDGDPKQVTVSFTKKVIAAAAEERITELAAVDERFTIAGRQVYVDFAGGQARSKLAGALPNALGQTATTRNMRTVAALAERAR